MTVSTLPNSRCLQAWRPWTHDSSGLGDTPNSTCSRPQQDVLTSPDALPGMCNAEPCSKGWRACNLPYSSRTHAWPLQPTLKNACKAAASGNLCSPCAHTIKLCTASACGLGEPHVNAICPAVAVPSVQALPRYLATLHQRQH